MFEWRPVGHMEHKRFVEGVGLMETKLPSEQLRTSIQDSAFVVLEKVPRGQAAHTRFEVAVGSWATY